MAKTNITQPSFSSGIISPELFSRIDFSKINSGLKECENWVVRPAGGVIYRVGTKYINETKYPLKNVSLIPFIYNRKDGLCLEFGDKYIRFYKDGNIIKSNNQVYEVATTYTDQEVQEIKCTQDKNTLYLVHPNHIPAKLVRIKDNEWKLSDISFNPTVPQVAKVAISNPNTQSGINENWQYAVSVVNNDGEEGLPTYSNILTSDIDLVKHNLTITFDRPAEYSDIDKFFIYRVRAGKFFLMYTLKYEDKQTFSFKDISYASDETKTPKKSFSDFGVGNYPSAIGFWQQRLVLANTQKKPSTFWMSRTGSPEDFSSRDYLVADDPIELTFNSGAVDAITDLIPMDDLIVFTLGKIWRVSGTSFNNMKAYIESYSGSSGIRPFATKKSILYVDSSENTISNFVYSYELNGYSGENLDILCRTLFEGHKIKDISFRDSPFGVMYVIREDGIMLGLTYLREENIWAWHKHTTPNGKYRNICSIDKNSHDDVYTVVERGNKTYVEMFGNYINATQDINDSWHLDCATKVQSNIWKWKNVKESPLIVYKGYEKTKDTKWYCYGFLPKYGYQFKEFYYSRSEKGGDWYGDEILLAPAENDLNFRPYELEEHKYNITRQPENDLKYKGPNILYVLDEVSGSKVYDKQGENFVEIGRNDVFGNGTFTFNDTPYLKKSSADVTVSSGEVIVTYCYTVGQPEMGDKAFDSLDLTTSETISAVSDGSITVNGVEFLFESKSVDGISRVDGLERFNGQKITALADTNVYENLEVKDGVVNLPIKANNVLVGLQYEGVIETIPQEVKFSSGNSTVGANRKINDGILSYYRARGLWYGRDYKHLYMIKPYTQETYSFNIPLESGKLNLKVADGFNMESTFMVVQKSPVPAIIQSITLGSTYNDKN